MDYAAQTAYEESLVPIQVIRAHIRDDDTYRYSDEQLTLYRGAAIEACETYTGVKFGQSTYQVSENVTVRQGYGFGARPTMMRLKSPCVDGILSINSGGSLQTLVGAPGAREFNLSIINETLNFGNCGGACGGSPTSQITVTYKTGNGFRGDVPRTIILGLLKFIAWSAENPGDDVVTIQGYQIARGQTLQGTNSAVIASGASELWRLSRRSLVIR